MGDDLTAARRFCDAVRSDMTSLMDGVCAQPCAASDVLIGSLDNIQSGAKLIHARGIYSAAQRVANSLAGHAPLPKVQGRILSLNKLIYQYETGLDDIAPRPANLNDTDAAENGGEPPIAYTVTEPPMPDIDARYRVARAVLAPLMAFAPQGHDRNALVKLADFSKDELPVVAAGSSISAPPKIRPSAALNFETLMPEFVSRALHEARQSDKTVSVSYAADDVNFDACHLSALQTLFGHIAKTFVQSVLERPDVRRARGLSGAGHIALTAVQDFETLTVSIECPGRPIAIKEFFQPNRMPSRTSVLEGLKITAGSNAHDGLAHIVMTMPRRAKAPGIAPQTHSNSAEMAL